MSLGASLLSVVLEKADTDTCILILKHSLRSEEESPCVISYKSGSLLGAGVSLSHITGTISLYYYYFSTGTVTYRNLSEQTS